MEPEFPKNLLINKSYNTAMTALKSWLQSVPEELFESMIETMPDELFVLLYQYYEHDITRSRNLAQIASLREVLRWLESRPKC